MHVNFKQKPINLFFLLLFCPVSHFSLTYAESLKREDGNL